MFIRTLSNRALPDPNHGFRYDFDKFERSYYVRVTEISRPRARLEIAGNRRVAKPEEPFMPRRYFSFTTACLLRLFESANDYTDQDHYRTYAIWHGFFARDDEDVHAPLLNLCLWAWVLSQRTYAFWHGFGSA